MSEAKPETASDDEFQDALTNEQLVDDLRSKTDKLQLSNADADSEDEEEFAVAAPLTAEEQENVITETIEEAAQSKPNAEYLDDDDINEEQLKAREQSMSEEELCQSKADADKLKLEGNELFANEEAGRAVEVYTEALKICPTQYAKDRAILYGNRAAAKIKLESRKSAIGDCTKSIELWPEYVRAILRRAKLYEHEEKLEEALEDYKRVYELDAGQRDAREAMVRLPPVIQERNERLKEEMMSKLKDLGNMFLKPFGLSTANFQMQQDPNSGGYSINFNQNQNQG